MNFSSMLSREYQFFVRISTVILLSVFGLITFGVTQTGFMIPAILCVLGSISIFFTCTYGECRVKDAALKTAYRFWRVIGVGWIFGSIGYATLLKELNITPSQVFWALYIAILMCFILGAIQMIQRIFEPWHRLFIEILAGIIIILASQGDKSESNAQIFSYLLPYALMKFFFIDYLVHRSPEVRDIFTSTTHGFRVAGWLVFIFSILLPVMFWLTFW